MLSSRVTWPLALMTKPAVPPGPQPSYATNDLAANLSRMPARGYLQKSESYRYEIVGIRICGGGLLMWFQPCVR